MSDGNPAGAPRRPADPAGKESPYKSLGGLRRTWHAFGHSIRGLAHALQVESSFRQELALAALLIPFAFMLRLEALETVALVGSVLMVLIVELLNSSVEATVDRISFDHHRLSGRAKDLGSAAVFIALLLCLLTWLLVAGPALIATGRALLSLALR
jgi:diacylglycerol kinase (ATP)